MKLLVYTCVFGRYDWVFPPILAENDLTYLIVTDDPSMQVPGWRTQVVDSSAFPSATLANRHYKMLSHQVFPEFDGSLYIDGNIRLLGRTSQVLRIFMSGDACLGLYPHPLRTTVREEARVCVESAKIADADCARLAEELEYYSRAGFPDEGGLIEATIILKNHRHPALATAMELWWDLFRKFETRDQISLPFVRWKTGVPCMLHSTSFREPNPYFGLYAHRGDQRAPRHYPYVEGRSYDSAVYSTLLRTWKASWAVRRAARRGLRAMGLAQ